MKTLSLSKGKHTIVDDEDYEALASFKWHLHSGGYAVRNARKAGRQATTILLHRHLLNASQEQSVDHINGDKLDNRRCNLRLCTHSENMKNQRRNSQNISGYRGVSWARLNKKWRALIVANGIRHSLGLFRSAEQAAHAYNAAATKLHGQFARLNEIKESKGA